LIERKGLNAMTLTDSVLTLTLLLAAAPSSFAQPAKPSPEATVPKPCPDCAARRKDWDSVPTHTFYLKYAIQPADMNEIVAVLRVLLPEDDKTILVPQQGAIVVRAIPEDIALVEKILADLDRPKKTWRLTYTLSEMDGEKRVGTQHYSMVVKDAQQTVMKQGNRVPIVTAASSKDVSSTTQTQFAYQDVGMTFSATLDGLQEGGARLRSDVVKTSLADEKSGFGQQDPVFRQSELKGEATLAPGKPLVLGSMDMPGTTHHLQIEALMEPLP
jgi:hypothetical protein